MKFKTKTLDTLEGTMFGYDAKVIIRTKLTTVVDDGPWSQVQLWVSCGGESIFTWGCIDRDDEAMIFDWWYVNVTRWTMPTSQSADHSSEVARGQKEILEES